MTKNNQKTYERPTLQVLFVEAESVMVTDSGYGATIRDFNYDEDETLGCYIIVNHEKIFLLYRGVIGSHCRSFKL